ncbi:MAG: hypothetical protein LBH70_08675 [Spirochaetaceae bacterium]|nr:hypothetical protein [Spirochaetaceae bacterium]
MTREKLDQLHSKFMKLSIEHQFFIMGFIEGLKRAQDTFGKDVSMAKTAPIGEK